MMKRIITVVLVALYALPVSAQIPNNGFETWNNMGTYSVPDGWGNTNPATTQGGTYTCLKGSPGNPGDAYLKLISNTVAGMGIVPGIAVSGQLNSTTFQPVSGFPFTGRPQSLNGNWQYMAFGEDMGYISVLLTKWNGTARDTIAFNYFVLEGMVMSWRSFSIPIDYLSNEHPDSAMVVLSASNANGAVTAVASYLYVDNLTFTDSVSGTGDLKIQGIKIYPNPCTDLLTVSNQNHQALSAEIIDFQGRPVQNLSGSNDLNFDLKTQAPGM
ncbi:MAG: T9SS type A sorting domain-containing protein, partial [Syntrophothermus sp.]